MVIKGALLFLVVCAAARAASAGDGESHAQKLLIACSMHASLVHNLVERNGLPDSYWETNLLTCYCSRLLDVLSDNASLLARLSVKLVSG